MMVMMTISVIVGRIDGSSTSPIICQKLAPSMRAASMCSRGTWRSAAKKITQRKPHQCQRSTVATPNRAVEVPASGLAMGRPRRLTRPKMPVTGL